MNPMFFVFLAVVAGLLGLQYLAKLGTSKKKGLLLAKLAENAKIIDVRTKAEYKTGAYPGALNIPLDTLSKSVHSLGQKSQPLIIYCASGVRSAQATRTLKALGYTAVLNAGGLGKLRKMAEI